MRKNLQKFSEIFEKSRKIADFREFRGSERAFFRENHYRGSCFGPQHGVFCETTIGGGLPGPPGPSPPASPRPPHPRWPHGEKLYVSPYRKIAEKRHRGGAGADLGRLERASGGPADVHLDWDNGQNGRTRASRGRTRKNPTGVHLGKKLHRRGGGVVRWWGVTGCRTDSSNEMLVKLY